MGRKQLHQWIWVCSFLTTLAFQTSIFAAPSIWVMDDGERILQDNTSSALEQGTGNAVWSPGGSVQLYALRGETVAIQVVVEADSTALENVTVALSELTGPESAIIANDPGANDPLKFVGRRIEMFVEHFFDVKRASGGPWGSLGGINAGEMTGLVPDALIPIEVAPDWAPYPMSIAANTNGVIWIDIYVPKGATPGEYVGDIAVSDGSGRLDTIHMALNVDDHVMPTMPVKTMLFYSRDKIGWRMGAGVADAAEKYLWQLYHRHQISPMHSVMSSSALVDHIPALKGSVYTAAEGYAGPGENTGDGILSLGTYGGFGTPDSGDLSKVEDIADALAAQGLFDSTDVFVYAIDEACDDVYGQGWVDLLASSSNANIKKVNVGWTCSSNPSLQSVDIVMMAAQTYDPTDVPAAEVTGKQVWIYNGYEPYSGAFMTDHATIGTRVNGWIAAIHDIDRWFYWESTFWYDDNPGGWGAFDPFATPETFHNQYNEYAQGDGLLVYPGKQVDQFTYHSVGMNGIIASIRLKNWRRGIQDAGYYKLAKAHDATATAAVTSGLIPRSLQESAGIWETAWSSKGADYFNARKSLWDILDGEFYDPGTEGDTDLDTALDSSPDTSPGTTPDTSPGTISDTDPGTVPEPDGDPSGPDGYDPQKAVDEGCGCALPGARTNSSNRPYLFRLLFSLN